MRTSSEEISVLHAPTCVGGYAQALARKESKLGIDSWALNLSDNVYGYDEDRLINLAQHRPLVLEIYRVGVIIWAACKFDIIHYNFGTTIANPPYPYDANRKSRFPAWFHKIYWRYTSFLQWLELSLFKMLGKGILVTYQGNDARQGDYCRQQFKISAVDAGGLEYYSPIWDAEKRRRIKLFDQFANEIYSVNPDLMHVLPGRTRFLPYGHLDLDAWQPVDHQPNSVPHLVHAPSHRGMKGTHLILDAVQQLQKEELPFTFQLVENLTNKEARKVYEQADLLVDQLLIGWYGGLSLELMALGKPVICYIREEDLQFIPEKMRAELPIIQTTPAQIIETLRQWLTAPAEQRIRQGQKSRIFVENWHNPDHIVAGLVKDYRRILEKKG